jgi:hypothetical protein
VHGGGRHRVRDQVDRVVVMSVLGHATWHLYRKLVPR